ncbi:MAG: flagellar FlbD family protein [Oscillospiraceae bacterium]|nr:flagellar FlbD family protein [Oscillospiraceae bacterium]
MIKLTRLNGKEFYFNSEIIETLDVTPDTVITTVQSKKFIVKESIEDIVDRIIEFRGRVFRAQKDNERN